MIKLGLNFPNHLEKKWKKIVHYQKLITLSRQGSESANYISYKTPPFPGRLGL